MFAKRVVILDIDGLRPEALHTELSSGTLPNIEQILGRNLELSYTVDACSVAPSSTYPNQASIITGQHPAEHGISGNDYFDRLVVPREGARLPYHRGFDLMHLRTLHDAMSVFPRGYANRCLSRESETLYETCERRGTTSLQTFSMFWRGASSVVTPSTLDTIRFFAGGRIFGLSPEEYDARMVNSLRRTLGDAGAQDPELLCAYFLGNDVHSHTYGPDAQPDFLRRYLDERVGRLIDVLDAARLFEESMFVVVSDHGHRRSTGDGRRALRFGYPFHRQLDPLFRALALSVPALQPHPFTARAVIGLNGGLAHVYVRSRDGDWRTIPNSIHDTMPVADAFFEMNRRGKFVPRFKDTLDMVLIKDTHAARDWRAPYLVYVGDGRTERLSNYLKNHPELDYLDAENRLRLASCHTSGDIILLANGRQGFFFGNGGMKGTHGGLYREESRAVLSFALPHATNNDRARFGAMAEDAVNDRCQAEGDRNPSVADLAHVLRQTMLRDDASTAESDLNRDSLPMFPSISELLTEVRA